MSKTKIVYADGQQTKVIFGVITSEDLSFISITADNGTKFRLNKSTVISIKEVDQ